RRSHIDPDQVDAVLMGQVIQAGSGQMSARQAATIADIPLSVPATSINKACLSGLNTIHLADLMVRAGEADVIVAGGMESMTQAPFLITRARGGLRFGDEILHDSILHDGLRCGIEHLVMGEATDRDAALAGILREAQDRVALLSNQRAAASRTSGRMAEEIAPVTISKRGKDLQIVSEDEGIRADTTIDSLAALRPAFANPGTVTAGNASQLSDGGAAVVVTSLAHAERLGVQPIAEIVGYGQVAGPDASLLLQPANAIRAALKSSELEISEIDLFEINEAFAAVVVASSRDLGLADDVVNINGGAISLGHPIGMSGSRLALTLAYELRDGRAEVGAAALCGGGGQGDAILLRAVR
ncbi:MAG TPA: acetyl-CoA C-acyltransferase, partial [Acidimicrobiales bacterium]|nr:acetyl-CoA C-acyltransferase [Acidimicrobiales bacterium]